MQGHHAPWENYKKNTKLTGLCLCLCVKQTDRQREQARENKKETSGSGAQQSDPSGQNPSCCGFSEVAMATAPVPLTCVTLCMLASQI